MLQEGEQTMRENEFVHFLLRCLLNLRENRREHSKVLRREEKYNKKRISSVASRIFFTRLEVNRGESRAHICRRRRRLPSSDINLAFFFSLLFYLDSHSI
jgi:hypothetical protein